MALQKKPVISPNFLVRTFFGKTDSAGKVSEESPKTLWKLCPSTKFPHQDIRWNYGNFHSVANVAIMQWVTKTWTCYHIHYRMYHLTYSLKLAWFCAVSFVLGFYPLPLVIFYHLLFFTHYIFWGNISFHLIPYLEINKISK